VDVRSGLLECSVRWRGGITNDTSLHWLCPSNSGQIRMEFQITCPSPEKGWKKNAGTWAWNFFKVILGVIVGGIFTFGIGVVRNKFEFTVALLEEIPTLPRCHCTNQSLEVSVGRLEKDCRRQTTKKLKEIKMSNIGKTRQRCNKLVRNAANQQHPGHFRVSLMLPLL